MNLLSTNLKNKWWENVICLGYIILNSVLLMMRKVWEVVQHKGLVMCKNNVVINNKWEILSDTENTFLFKSKKHEILFYFKNFDNKFYGYLGIKKVHLVDKNKARLLKKEYLKIFSPDKNINKNNIDFDFNYNEACSYIEMAFKKITEGL